MGDLNNAVAALRTSTASILAIAILVPGGEPAGTGCEPNEEGEVGWGIVRRKQQTADSKQQTGDSPLDIDGRKFVPAVYVYCLLFTTSMSAKLSVIFYIILCLESALCSLLPWVPQARLGWATGATTISCCTRRAKPQSLQTVVASGWDVGSDWHWSLEIGIAFWEIFHSNRPFTHFRKHRTSTLKNAVRPPQPAAC